MIGQPEVMKTSVILLKFGLLSNREVQFGLVFKLNFDAAAAQFNGPLESPA